MRKNRTYTILAIVSAAVLALSGCTAASTETADAAQTAPVGAVQTATVDANATYVQVQSIESGAITAVVGTMTQPTGQQGDNAQGENAQGDNAQGGQMPSGDDAPQGTPPQTQSGDSAQQDPSSGAPAQGGMMGFTAGDAVITFQVNDATVVTKQNGPESAEATLDDIAVGDILAVTISNDNIATAIVIQSAGMGGK